MLEITMSKLTEEAAVDPSGNNTVLYVSCGVGGVLAVGGAIWWFSGSKFKYNGKELTDDFDKKLLNNKKDLSAFGPDAKVNFNLSCSTVEFEENFLSCSISFEDTHENEEIFKKMFDETFEELGSRSCKKSALKSDHIKIINDRIAAIDKENAKIFEEKKKHAEAHESPVKVEFIVNFNKDDLNKDIAYFCLNDKKELEFKIGDAKNEIQNIFSFDIYGYMMSQITIPEGDIDVSNSFVFYEENQDIRFMHTVGYSANQEKSSGVIACSELQKDIILKLLECFPSEFKYLEKDSPDTKEINVLFGCKSTSKPEFKKLVNSKSLLK